jgi:hypothetical protein
VRDMRRPTAAHTASHLSYFQTIAALGYQFLALDGSTDVISSQFGVVADMLRRGALELGTSVMERWRYWTNKLLLSTERSRTSNEG